MPFLNTKWTRFRGCAPAIVARDPSCMSADPSPSKTSTRRSGHASARPRPSDDAPPMNPMHVTERSLLVSARHAGIVVMVGTQIAVPRLSAMIRNASSGVIAMSARLHPHQNGGGAASLPAQAEVLRNEVHVVRALDPDMRHPEGIQQRLTVADHGLGGVAWIAVPLTAEQADDVEDRHAPVDRHAAQGLHRGIEPRVLDHTNDR